MKEELITFETAKLAKEKGFPINDSTITWYEENGEINEVQYPGDEGLSDYISIKVKNEEQSLTTGKNPIVSYEDGFYLAPTQSLLQKWLREEQKILVVVTHKILDYKGNNIKFTTNTTVGIRNGVWYDSYEEALEKGLQEALKLIP